MTYKIPKKPNFRAPVGDSSAAPSFFELKFGLP